MTITKSAVTAVPVHELIAERWSPRAFNGHAVSQDQIHALLEAARWAPSSYNLQPWRFVVWNRDDNADTFDKVYATLSSSNKAWVANVPVLIGVFADRRGVDGHSGTFYMPAGISHTPGTLPPHDMFRCCRFP